MTSQRIYGTLSDFFVQINANFNVRYLRNYERDMPTKLQPVASAYIAPPPLWYGTFHYLDQERRGRGPNFENFREATETDKT